MTTAAEERLRERLDAVRAAGRWRMPRVLEGRQAPEQVVDGRRVLAFCSNDYLGLASDPRVTDAARTAIERYGLGAGAAHLVNGHTRAHAELEEALADFTGRPRALLFSTGYMANLGVLQALAGRRDAVLEDRLNHASLIDASRLAGCRVRRYRHADAEHAASLLAATAPGQSSIIATDGVFSMDGDLAPLPALADAARRRGAWLMVDDAHGLGVLGDQGGGSCEHFGLSPDEVPILMGTLGKAFGTAGAFVAGSTTLIEGLVQFARTYIYTTAMPAALAAATRVSLDIARSEGWRREHLRALIQRLQQGFAQLGLPVPASPTPIQPLLLGSSRLASETAAALLEAGVLVPAIRPPTVPEGTARLRITLSASHSETQVDRLLETLERVLARTRTAYQQAL
ncbi:8-amino-7-oxononanoate synthase [Thioalkalivibrio sp.]|uniref:8-amino-7-oxononanoate synthase n=1 Tax=Thioalkalivibrio sp. TaxID=2093813 RepID=UPI0012D4E635|nr:8-amino-7-oxononanoate synthase [Thioalkalivibrio sp.]TVP82076.1 MAG: 8-amino-7-oxononanoate synthase [Thioalkalivibrio sp.]